MNIKLLQPEREKEMLPFLPEVTILDSLVKPKIEKLYPTFTKAIKEEIEILRKIPKGELVTSDLPSKDKEKEWDEKSFEPRHPSSCFMGKVFKQKVGQSTTPLNLYREKIGTVRHEIWGDVTLLEIWGGDHYKDYPKMVESVFRYIYGYRGTLPKGIKFHVNPLTPNSKTGKMRETVEDKERREWFEDLHARAEVFGVRTAKEASRARKRR